MGELKVFQASASECKGCGGGSFKMMDRVLFHFLSLGTQV